MDINGTRFWMLAGEGDWTPADDPDRTGWSGGCLRLVSQRGALVLSEDREAARALVERVPMAIDGLGSVARVEDREPEGDVPASHRIVVSHPELPDAVILDRVEPVTGVAYGSDGLITAIVGGDILLRDSRTLEDRDERWRPLFPRDFAIQAPIEAWRAAPARGGGAWVLDRQNRRLLRWSGTLLRNWPSPETIPGTFRPDPEDPETISLKLIVRQGFSGEEPVAIASSAEGRVAVLCWRPGPTEADPYRIAQVHVFEADGSRGPVHGLGDLRHPVGLAWVGEDRVAVLALEGATPLPDAAVYPVGGHRDPVVQPVGDRYPLRRHDGSPLLLSPDGTPRYRAADGPRALRALSLPLRATRGEAIGRPLDSGNADTSWHRLYIEARMPEGCGVQLLLAASDSRSTDESTAWFRHDLGTVPEPTTLPVPSAAWLPFRSELPHHEGVLGAEPLRDRAGLFTLLVQRPGRRSGRLVGRFLHIRAILHGNGRSTPEIAAIRAWGPRFSYVRRYLPELYHEDPLLDGGPEEGPATPADFTERFVALFEGVLSPLEDKVAESWQLSHPRTSPRDALPWLARWLGRSLDSALPEKAMRRMIAGAALLSRWRGTRRGLEMCLELVTDGGISRGEIVVLEDWRLRRTWATILGADLADEDDPLLQGLAISGNSIVGDTLILGVEHHREFLALFGQKVYKDNTTDADAVKRFFDESAHRATVLVFEGTDEQTMGLIRRTVAEEAPAHVRVEVKPASSSFIVGMTALIGVDTRLGVEPPPATVRLGKSLLGAGDRLRRPPALHPDVEASEGEGG